MVQEQEVAAVVVVVVVEVVVMVDETGDAGSEAEVVC